MGVVRTTPNKYRIIERQIYLHAFLGKHDRIKKSFIILSSVEVYLHSEDDVKY